MLDRVTVTGADDTTELRFIEELSRRNPFLEWGILLSSSAKAGRPRFPSLAWLDNLADIVGDDHYPEWGQVRFSAHLCGEWVRRACRGDWCFTDEIGRAWGLFTRIQLNFHAYPHVIDRTPFYKGLRHLEPQVIFQIDGCNDHLVSWAYDEGCGVAALYDRSGGAGIVPDEWPVPLAGIPAGYAGGLGPRNVADELVRIAAAVGDRGPVWIDAETQLRTPDGRELNEEAVETFVANASPMVISRSPSSKSAPSCSGLGQE